MTSKWSDVKHKAGNDPAAAERRRTMAEEMARVQDEYATLRASIRRAFEPITRRLRRAR